MSYCSARYETALLDKAYRVYVTEALRMTAENAAKSVGGGYLSRSFKDVLDPPKPETRTAEEIVEHIKTLLGREERTK